MLGENVRREAQLRDGLCALGERRVLLELGYVPVECEQHYAGFGALSAQCVVALRADKRPHVYARREGCGR